MKKYIIHILILSFILFSSGALEAAKKPGRITAEKPKTGTVVKKKSAKKRVHKKRIYVAPPQEELKAEEIPIALPIPVEVINFLSANDLDNAARTLRVEPPASRSLRLLHDIQKILLDKKGKKEKIDKHTYYQNLGISYHNLFLFLKRYQIVNEDFAKKALKFYGKASSTKSLIEKAQIQVLVAALMAADNQKEKASEKFEKIDKDFLINDFLSLEYLASYYAAMEDVENAVYYLNAAFKLKPDQIKLWVQICDDFALIEDKEEFKSLASKWHVKIETKGPRLSLPKAGPPKLK